MLKMMILPAAGEFVLNFIISVQNLNTPLHFFCDPPFAIPLLYTMFKTLKPSPKSSINFTVKQKNWQPVLNGNSDH